MINWAHVAELYDDLGQEGFAEVAEVFLEEVSEGLERLSNAKSPEKLHEEFHFLKGAALNLGFEEVAAICLRGETHAAQGQDTRTEKAELLACLPNTCATFAQQWRQRLTHAR